MMQLGFNMEGTEERFEHWLAASIGDRQEVFYLEIGVANCRTFSAVAVKLESWLKRWICFGYDLFDSPYFNAHSFLHAAPHRAIVCAGYGDRSPFDGLPLWRTMQVFLSGVPDLQYRCPPLHFCLIDACHGKACVIRDFTAIESAMPLGSIVAFHDACLEDQGGTGQHCGNGIEVRAALLELHLLPTTKRVLGSGGDYEDWPSDYRPGWQFLEEVHGDKRRNGNGFVFVQKL